MLANFRLRVCGLENHKQYFVTREEGDLTNHMCGQACEDEVNFRFLMSGLCEFTND